MLGAHRNLGKGSDRKGSGGPGAAGQARMPTQARRAATLPALALQSAPVLQTPRDHAALPWAARASQPGPFKRVQTQAPHVVKGALRVGPRPRRSQAGCPRRTSWLFFTVSPLGLPPTPPSTLLLHPHPITSAPPGTPRARRRPLGSEHMHTPYHPQHKSPAAILVSETQSHPPSLVSDPHRAPFSNTHSFANYLDAVGPP